MKKILRMTVGLPRSGKSTWAKNTSKEEGIPIVSPDAIRLALYGERWKKEGETMVWAITRYMVKALFIAGHDEVILDCTNHTKERRAQWLSNDWSVMPIEFPAEKELCIQRAIDTNQNDLIPIIEKMNDEYETCFPFEENMII